MLQSFACNILLALWVGYRCWREILCNLLCFIKNSHCQVWNEVNYLYYFGFAVTSHTQLSLSNVNPFCARTPSSAAFCPKLYLPYNGNIFDKHTNKWAVAKLGASRMCICAEYLFSEWPFKQISIVFNWEKCQKIYLSTNGRNFYGKDRRSSSKAISINWKSHNRVARKIYTR